MTAPSTLWVSPVANMAGVARHIRDVARVGLPGWNLVVAAPAGPLTDELRALGIVVHTYDPDGPIRRAVTQLRHIIQDAEPDIVHSHLAKADVFVAMAAPRGMTLVSTEHHIQADQRVFHGSSVKAHVKVAMHRARLRRFGQLIAVSESTKRDVLRHWKPSAPITVIRNGVDRPDEVTSRAPGLRLLSLTRLSHEKNLATTLRVFAAVRAEHPEATLTVAGEGPEEHPLRALADELRVADGLTFAGFVDPMQAMATHDVLLQPSLADNLSYTLLDAVAHGMGVAASDIGGNDEILPPHCMADPCDVEALARIAVEQGFDLRKRPSLPESIPTVQQMAGQIVDVYARSGFVAPSRRDALSIPVNAQTPEISVVTAYYKNAATLGEQLDALVAQQDAPRFEVVIADNEGSSVLPLLVEPYRDLLDIRIVPANEVAGQCHARNVGVAAARAPYLAMTDADDVVTPRWLASLHAMVCADDVLATGPMRLDRINSRFVCEAKARLEGFYAVPEPFEHLPFGFLGHLQFAIGSNIGIRRSTYLELGGMNETMLGGSEDVDFSWRLLESGRDIAVDQNAVVDYRLRSDPKDVMTQGYRYQRAQLAFWRLSEMLGRPVRGMSFRWAVTQTARLPLEWWNIRSGDAMDRYVLAMRTGSIFGNLRGQIAVRGPWWNAPDETVVPESIRMAREVQE